MSMELGPYTNFHELNQDWFLTEFNKVLKEWAEMKKSFNSLNEAFNNLRNYVHDYFKNLNVQKEIDKKLDSMVSDGTLISIINPYISPTIDDWLHTNIKQNENVIDSSLTLKNASANSFCTGTLIKVNHNNNVSKVNIGKKNIICKDNLIKGFSTDATGVITENNEFYVTQFIKIDNTRKIYSKGGVGLTICFDENFKYIGSTIPTDSGFAIFTTGTVYIMCNIHTKYVNTAMLSYDKEEPYDDGVQYFESKNTIDYLAGNFNFFEVEVNQDFVTPNSNYNDYVNNAKSKCYILLPQDYKNTGKPFKLIAVCHGAGGGVDYWTQNDDYKKLVGSLRDNGFCVFDCDGYAETDLGEHFWGNIRGMTAWIKAYQYIQNNFNVETNIGVYGFSMGGMTALQLTNYMPFVKTLCLGSPVTSLKNFYDLADNDGKTAIRASYGMGDEYNSELTIGQDPFLAIKNGSWNWKSVPTRMFFGSTETNPSKIKGKELIDAMRMSNQYAIYSEVENAGHEICYGANNDVNRSIIVWLLRYM